MIFDHTQRLLFNYNLDSIKKMKNGDENHHYITDIYNYNKDGKVISESIIKQEELEIMKVFSIYDISLLVLEKDLSGTPAKNLEVYQSYLLKAKKNAKAEQTKYDYNKNGDVSKIIYLEDGKPIETFLFSYTYDAKGNWITCTAKVNAKDKTLYDTDYIVMARLIEYYE